MESYFDGGKGNKQVLWTDVLVSFIKNNYKCREMKLEAANI